MNEVQLSDYLEEEDGPQLHQQYSPTIGLHDHAQIEFQQNNRSDNY